MYKLKNLMILKALTPMHAGGGNEISAVDLPIQREIHTNFPKIEASTFKGCIRDAFRFNIDDVTLEEEIFGSERKENMHAAAVSCTDARILFFPVRSAKGIFAYVTCPFVLKRFFSELKAMGIESDIEIPKIQHTEDGVIVSSDDLLMGNDIVLEEQTYKNVKKIKGFADMIDGLSNDLPDCNMRENFKCKSVLLSDDEFKNFVEMSTDVITRIKVEASTGTTDGGLFDVEYLPAESILYSFLFVENSNDAQSQLKAADIYKHIKETLKHPIQIGGNATLGKGFTFCKIVEKAGDRNESNRNTQ